MSLARRLPLPAAARSYRMADLPSDVVAGIVTAVLLVPQSMAYAQLAGLPPQVGLYASVAPLAVYALLGTSPQLSVGPVAITSLLVASGIGGLAEPGSARYVVNDQAGAVTGAASLVTAAVIGLILLGFTPLFAYLPQAVLAATVIVAVARLVDLGEPLRIGRASRGDAAVWAITFGAVLLVGVEAGIFAGVAASLALLLWRSSRPHIAIVGRLGDGDVYRNVLRHDVQTWPHVVAVRVDESLFFANARFLEQALLRVVADRPAVRHLVLIGSAINAIDSSALHTLEQLLFELRAGGVQLHLAEIKGPVMDGLRRTDFLDALGIEHVHFTTDGAMRALGCR